MNKEELEKERIELCSFLLNESRKLEKENTELEDRIQKAIEYIKHYGNLYCLRHKQFKEYKQYEDLLDILKGGNNE